MTNLKAHPFKFEYNADFWTLAKEDDEEIIFTHNFSKRHSVEISVEKTPQDEATECYGDCQDIIHGVTIGHSINGNHYSNWLSIGEGLHSLRNWEA